MESEGTAPTAKGNPAEVAEASRGGEAPRITLTREAADFVRRRLEKENRPGAALRVGVKGGGCNGLTYVTEYTDAPPRSRDLVYDFHGVKVYVDKRSLEYIDGAMIEYQNTLMYQGLKFRNPLEASSCGCGATFSVKDDVLAKRRERALPTVGK